MVGTNPTMTQEIALRVQSPELLAHRKTKPGIAAGFGHFRLCVSVAGATASLLAEAHVAEARIEARDASAAVEELLLAAGYQFLVVALRSGGEISVMASFRYSSILWALGIGYVVWGEVPNALAIAGIVVIVGSGLYILHRERVRH